MKKVFLLLGLVSFVTMSFVASSESEKVEDVIVLEDDNVPSEVKKVIENKCYGCHNSESKNEKGRKKLSFDKMSSYSTAKQIAKYEGIFEVVEEGKMPPKKFLKKYPGKALSAEETKSLITWANSEAEKLMN